MMDSVVAAEVAELSRTLLGCSVIAVWRTSSSSSTIVPPHRDQPRVRALQLVVSASTSPFSRTTTSHGGRNRRAAAAEAPPRGAVGWYQDLDLQVFLALRKQGDLTLRRWVRVPVAVCARWAVVPSHPTPFLFQIGEFLRGRVRKAPARFRNARISRTMRALHVQRAHGGGSERHLLALFARVEPPVSRYQCARSCSAERFVDASGPPASTPRSGGSRPCYEICCFRPDLVHTHLVLMPRSRPVRRRCRRDPSERYLRREPYRSAGRMVGRLAVCIISEYVADFIRRPRLALPHPIVLVPYGTPAGWSGVTKPLTVLRRSPRLRLRDRHRLAPIEGPRRPHRGRRRGRPRVERGQAARRRRRAERARWRAGSAPRARCSSWDSWRTLSTRSPTRWCSHAAGAERGFGLAALEAMAAGRNLGDRVSRGVAAGSGRRRRHGCGGDGHGTRSDRESIREREPSSA